MKINSFSIKLFIVAIVLGGLLLSFPLFSKDNSDKSTLVEIQNGSKLCGKIEQVTVCDGSSRNVRSYLAIPYAEPPTGVRRWEKPVPKAPWKGVYQATGPCPACPQTESIFSPLPDNMMEDCLYLNIWTPADASPHKPKPVMVFIHGGGFIGGSSNIDFYQGTYLAGSGDVVVVSLNYRLGVLGWLVYKDDSGTIEGNFGLQDQVLAIQWVKDNIKKFGGDDNNITLFGQSAGAISIGYLLAMENIQQNFHAAVMESNPIALPYLKKGYAELIGKMFAKDLGCKTITSMRDKCWKEVLEASGKVQGKAIVTLGLEGFLCWRPSYDKELVSMQQIHKKPRKPVIIGHTPDEGLIVPAMLRDMICQKNDNENEDDDENDSDCIISDSLYKVLITVMFRDKENKGTVSRILEEYPPHKGDNFLRFGKVFSDFMFASGNHYYLTETAKDSKDIYAYYFTYASKCNPIHEGLPECDRRACHSDELVYVFHTFDALAETGCIAKKKEFLFSDNIQKYWTSFAKDRKPSGVYFPWRKYYPSQHYLELKPEINKLSAKKVAHEDNYRFWKPIIEALNETPKEK